MTKLQRGAFAIILGAGLAAGSFAAYKWSQARSKRLAQKQTALPTPAEVFSVPPFSTREPDRYHATRIITSSDGDSGTAPPRVTRVLIARDGDKRREDYESDSALRTVYLEVPAGTFVLLPAKKLYADIKSASANVLLDGSGADLPPPGLLNESPGARFEKLGSEKLDGRAATKYRVTSAESTSGTEAPSVTLIWIDEALGMPIRSETEVSAGDHRAKLTIELRDIELQVDPKLFELPNDYKRAEDSELRDWLRRIRAGEVKVSSRPCTLIADQPCLCIRASVNETC